MQMRNRVSHWLQASIQGELTACIYNFENIEESRLVSTNYFSCV